MLEIIQEYISNNSTLILISVCVLIGLLAFVVFRNNKVNQHAQYNNSGESSSLMPQHDLEGMDNVNMVCDLSSGICHSHQESQVEQQQYQMEQQTQPHTQEQEQ